MLSAYERERERNIATNKRKLAQLGIETTRPPPPASRSKPKRERPGKDTPSVPARKSPRSAAIVDSQKGETVATPKPRVADWWESVFAACERECSGVAAVWDAKRHHQHLTCSSTRSVVATTGVAGYGAALVGRSGVGTSASVSWEVKAVRFGVGGFGVGVARATMKPPFKSLGNHADVVGVYLANGSVVRDGVERPFGPAYAPGDRVGVLLRNSAAAAGASKKGRANRELVFLLNGEEVGIAASGLGAEELVLAVQPYMGGVAQLL